MSTFPTDCPGDCTFNVPEFEADDCNPNVDEGQIDRIYIARLEAAALVNWDVITEWTARLSNVSPDDDAIRYLNVIADKPEPEGTEVEISRKRMQIINKKHTINFRTEETGAVNYEAMRTLECGGRYKVWYQSGKYLYGGNDGIDATIKMNEIIPESYQEMKTISGTVVWDSKFHPERCENPIE